MVVRENGAVKEKCGSMNAEIIGRLSVITKEEEGYRSGQSHISKTIYTEKKEWVIEGEKLLEKGKLIQIRPHSRFVHFPPHRHDYVEVIYMCRGTTTHIIDGERILLEEGNLLFLNQGATQEILPAKEEDIAVNFIILPEFFNTAFAMIGEEENLLREFLLECLRGKGRQPSYLHFKVADILPIQNLIENMVWTILNEQLNKRSSNQITMGLLLLHLLNYMDRLESGSRGRDQELVVTVLHYIEGYYRNGSLAELSRLLNMDLYRVSREIKKLTGRNFKELLQVKRLNQSAYLLHQTTMPVTEIIEMVGYDNTSYFFKIFKERFGVTPKEYRDNANKDAKISK